VYESITKSELPEGLLPIIERAHKLAPPSTGRFRHREAAALIKVLYCPAFVAICSMLFNSIEQTQFQK
jgi:hypothetical protein